MSIIDKVKVLDSTTSQYVTADFGINNLNKSADVNISNPANGEILIYDGTNSKWVNASIPSPSGKADKVTNAVNGNFAGLDSNGNLTDSGSKASDFLTSIPAASSNTLGGIKVGTNLSIDNNNVLSATNTNTLTDLTDTNIAVSPTDGNILKYDGTTHKWVNANITVGIGKDLTGQTVQPTYDTSVTAGTNAEIFGDYRERTYMGDAPFTGNVASGSRSHAEGACTTATGGASHAEGYVTVASGDYSHAEGEWTTASGDYSHAEGDGTTASGMASHAEGADTIASGSRTHAEGNGTIAAYDYQHVQGIYNNNKSTTLFEIGYGTAYNARSNAFEVYQNGALSQDNGTTKFKFTNVNNQDGYYDSSNTFHAFGGGGGSSGTVATGTLVAGETEVTITNNAITSTARIDCYTEDVFIPIEYIEVDATNHTITLTYPVQESNVNVAVVIV